ncbi:PREDICTED: F-box protein At1g10895-like [Camelina sativa]|uniref:F-box protein At1g10895-like n=1 Tax=Camelina sativa TaxID=90675 RepID=A0ABM0X4B7_CAMSA|nr:PREDICTED: F-box protein At1g10895-like [Camelina sativa]
MTRMSDLDENMVAEILCRVPMTCLKTVRSVCKTWNTLSKKGVIVAKEKQFLGFMMMNSRVCSLRYDLQGVRNEDNVVEPPSIKQISTLDQIEVSKIYHCDGLVLCVIKDDLTRVLVWNPYLGQTRWIQFQPKHDFHRLDRYALGYDKNSRNHKILRFVDDDYLHDVKHILRYEIYDFSLDSWRVLDVTSDWDIAFYQRGVSVKGNTYFFATEKLIFDEEEVGPQDIDTSGTEDFLLCFDFTAERFGPRLPLPFHSYFEETLTLSCVKEEQLSILYQRYEPYEMDIWVSTNIDPNAVSWSMFLKLDMTPLTGFRFDFMAASFFIDEENKVAVVFDLDRFRPDLTCRYQTAYIIGQDGYFNSVNIGEAPNLANGKVGYTWPMFCIPLVCSSSYVPSLVQIA